MPWPLSETVISICGPRPFGESTRAPTTIVPGGSVASMALASRLISTWRSAPGLRVRLLELPVGVGQLARRLAHARLEPRGQVLEARQHAVEAPGEEVELAAPRHAHACAQLARLGAAHAVHERGHGASDAPLEEDREQEG